VIQLHLYSDRSDEPWSENAWCVNVIGVLVFLTKMTDKSFSGSFAMEDGGDSRTPSRQQLHWPLWAD